MTVLRRGCSVKDPLDWWHVDAFMRVHLRGQPGRGGPFPAGAGRGTALRGDRGGAGGGRGPSRTEGHCAGVVTDSDVLSYRRGTSLQSRREQVYQSHVAEVAFPLQKRMFCPR